MIDIEFITNRLIEYLTNNSINFELYTFNSGAKMIDVMNNENFYVIQIDNDYIGLSEINENNPGFDLMPDKIFKSYEEFIINMNELLFIPNSPAHSTDNR